MQFNICLKSIKLYNKCYPGFCSDAKIFHIKTCAILSDVNFVLKILVISKIILADISRPDN